MLCHAELSTTQIYTQVSIHKLKQVHALTHPGAKLQPSKDSSAIETPTHEMATADLLSELAFEADDEVTDTVASKIERSITRAADHPRRRARPARQHIAYGRQPGR